MNHTVANWGKTFLRDTNAGLRSISQAASMGVQGDLMSNERWGRECMLQLQEWSGYFVIILEWLFRDHPCFIQHKVLLGRAPIPENISGRS